MRKHIHGNNLEKERGIKDKGNPFSDYSKWETKIYPSFTSSNLINNQCRKNIKEHSGKWRI